MMATSASGAVFFLGTRAHYQVLQQPESQYDIENGNSTETIYQNPSTQMWKRLDNVPMDRNYVNGTGNYYCDLNDVAVPDDKDNTLKRRGRRSSETTLCDRDELSPATLNSVGDSPPKEKQRKSLLSLLWSSRRKKRLASSQQYLKHLETALTTCTYRESCRCLHCQSSYFECDEEFEDYSSDDSEYTMYVAQAQAQALCEQQEQPPESDDEVFVDEVPIDDNTSTDLLLEPKKMSVSSESEGEPPENMDLEVAAGTPVLLNYLLTHPITCAIQ